MEPKSVTVSLAVLCVWSICLGLWLLHCSYVYYQLFKLRIPALHGRYSRSVILIGVLGAAYFIVQQPYVIYIRGRGVIPNEILDHLIYAITTQITGFVYPSIIVYRAWMVYYKIKWQIALENTKWNVFIDFDAKNRDWFLKNYEFNKKHAYKVPLLIWAVLSVIANIVGIFSTILVLGLYAIQYFTPLLLQSILLCKIPKYEDVFRIRPEIKFVFVTSLIVAALWLPFMILGFGVKVWGFVIINAYTITGPFCVVYSNLFFPFYHFQLPWHYWSLQRYLKHAKTESFLNSRSRSTEFSVDSAQSQTPNAGAGATSKNQITLKYFLENEEGFTVFARHINKEFCIESLIFLVEMNQFKMKLRELFANKEVISIDASDMFETVKFAKSAPQSTLVNSLSAEEPEEDSRNMYSVVVQLFLKYIDENGYFALNIGYHQRMELYSIFEFDATHSNNTPEIMVQKMMAKNMTKNEIYHIFDSAIKEIYSLLRQSVTRFRSSHEWTQFVAVNNVCN